MNDAANPGAGDALVYVHGFANSFESAIMRAAQLGFDLELAGPVVAFSWASLDSAQWYVADGNAAENAESRLVALLTGIIERAHPRKIHVVGHSMGGRLVTRALEAVALSRSLTVRLNEVILAAPDIDSSRFRREIAPRIAKVSERVTLYTSRYDRALSASSFAAAWRQRAGQGGPGQLVVPPVQTVDASLVDLGILGHSYYAESAAVMSDVHAILKGVSPDERKLCRRGAGRKNYWVFAAPGQSGCQ